MLSPVPDSSRVRTTVTNGFPVVDILTLIDDSLTLERSYRERDGVERDNSDTYETSDLSRYAIEPSSFLQAGVAGATGVGMSSRRVRCSSRVGHNVRHASLSDIEHVVILMQENRSFDHYFGVLSHVAASRKALCRRKS